MGAKGAVEILHRRATPEERAPLEADYEERLLNPYVAAERGLVDAVIDRPTPVRRSPRALDARQQAGVDSWAASTTTRRSRYADTDDDQGGYEGGRHHHDHRQPHRRSRSRSRSPTGCSRRRSCRELDPDLWFYDPAFMTTAACASAITELDGDAGILRYRGYPIEQLAEKSTYLEVAYLLLNGELPTADAVRAVDARHHVPHVHPRERAQAVHGGLPLRRPPDGDARLDHRRAVDLLPRREGHLRPRVPRQADRPPHRQDADARRVLPPLQRRHAVRLPGQHPELPGQLPVHDVEDRRVRPRPGARRRRSTCCSSSTPTTSRTAARPRCASSARPTPIRTPHARRPRAALYGPLPRRRQRGRRPHAHRDRLDRQRRPRSSRR